MFNQLVASAQAQANAANRSVAEQIEHWADDGRKPSFTL
ncbi:hypothetical protein NW622_004783 [Vibrio alginolyticus]|nr:hypothetical protein [Vibrio alginolyticus]